jgi:hypothetical protein
MLEAFTSFNFRRGAEGMSRLIRLTPFWAFSVAVVFGYTATKAWLESGMS